MEYKIVSVTLTEGLRRELDRLVHVEGMFLSRSDALRHGACLILLFARGTEAFNELKKYWKSV